MSDEEWVPKSHKIGAQGTITMKGAQAKKMFDQLADEERMGAEAYKVQQPGEAMLEKAEAARKSHPHNLTAKFATREYFEGLSKADQKAFLKITKSGIENADSTMGCYAMNPTDYEKFRPFFSNVLTAYHNVKPEDKHVTSWDLKTVEGLPEDGKLDLRLLALPPLSMRVRVGRNLSDFPLPGAMFQWQRVEMEKKLRTAFQALIDNPEYGGQYYSLTPGSPDFADADTYKQLVKDHIMFKDMSADSYLVQAGIASDWPHGRGCYVSEDKQFIIWVGEEDHLRIMCMKKGSILNEVFDRLKNASDLIESMCKFATAEGMGYVTSCPTNLGTGMRASVHIKVPKLTMGGSDKKARAICKPLGLSVRGLGGEHTPIGADGTIDLSPSARFIITEAQIIKALYDGVSKLKAAEDA